MSLPGLFSLLERLDGYGDLKSRLLEADGAAGATLPDAAKPLLLAALWREAGRPLLVVTARPEAARRLHDQLSVYLGADPSIQLLPEPDYLPYERLASDRSTVQQRLEVLAGLAGAVERPPPVVVASAYAVAAKSIHPRRFLEATLTISRGDRVDPMELLRRWESLGYQIEDAVEVPGAMSRRGGILDIYPPISDQPARIELLGDTVESIRLFDPVTQRSAKQVRSVTVTPASEMLAAGRDDLLDTLDLSGCGPEAQQRLRDELERLAGGERFEEMELYAPLVNEGSALDYLPPEALLVLDEPHGIRHALEEIASQADEVKAELVERRELPKHFPSPFLVAGEMEARTGMLPHLLRLEAFGGGEDVFPFSAAPAYAGRTRVLLNEVQRMLAEGQRVVLVSQQAPRLSELLGETTIPFQQHTELDSLPPSGSLSLLHASLAEGWTLPAEKTVLLTDAEIFGIVKQRRYSARPRRVRRQPFLSELSVGDYVVHVDHGVGRFVETMVRRTEDREREYLLLEYAAGDRLMVPTDQIDRVGPYVGASDRPPTLTRLGTQEWGRLKRRVRASTAQVARDLLGIYAAREVVVGQALAPDTPWQQELEASFPYVETPDQLRTIAEVKEDLERPKPMDRLVAGDVGYGKTEVALRAAFKVVMDGMQVAVLVPTTVLAQQHYNTFSERLAPFPVNVEMLSRFRSDREQGEVVRGLAEGKVDICIGTHRLVQKDVGFKNLGLVIVDEEQRFGVVYKERLKEMRHEVEVLSLSATPIPRTLYMALAGVRDMSVMETPPEERLPIKTYVAHFDEKIVREAVLREMERGGQVFFVHNRVHNIGYVAERLARLVPEAEVVVAHGQMPEEGLESAMLRFAQGEADILVSTTIIESGLDIPNVNTLIVNDADRMGLAQLYQLRGRVGRGANRAYAYFFYNPDGRLTETAEKRLKTILSATELGAGFRIAMKDLEIRGAGNLLGVEQHGHIAAVGLDLYVRLLGEAVEELKASLDGGGLPTEPKRPEPTIDLPMPAHLPEEYVADLGTRLALYQRMARIREPTEIDDLAEELKDRFGPWPEPVENLLFMLKVKLLAMKAGVLSISHQTGELVLAGDQKTWVGLLGVQRPYGDGVRIGHTRVRLDIKRLGNRWRTVLQSMLGRVVEGAEAASR